MSITRRKFLNSAAVVAVASQIPAVLLVGPEVGWPEVGWAIEWVDMVVIDAPGPLFPFPIITALETT